jgi:Spy/CpxP family protein refolding chaperone
MTRRTAWVFAAALACAAPTSAAVPCDTAGLPRGSHDAAQAGQKPDQGRSAAPQQPGSGAEGRGNNEHRVPWWKRPETRAELSISDKQSKDIDDIFQEMLPSLRAAKDDLDKLDDAVTKLIKEGTADVSVVAQKVAQAEQARANLTTKRTVMLYRMHRLLTPEQRVKLDAMFERREAERRKNNDPGRR